MKKLILIAISAFSINAFAQPVIPNGGNIPAPGLSAPVSMATATSGVGGAGINQTWNFSLLSFTTLGTLTVITPSSSPIGASFPTANYAYSFAGTYSFFKTSVSQMEVQAYSITTPGSGNDFTPNPRTILKFPFNYLDTQIDTWQKVAGPTNSVTITYDGYGTLITPTNTYSNIVRVKEDYGGGVIDYQWYALNPLISLMAYNFSTNKLYYTGATVTGVTEQNKSHLSVNVYPNPSEGKFFIKTENKTMLMEIYNSVGEKILSENNSNEINLSQFPKGIYFVKLFDGSLIHSEKIVVQ